MLSHNSELSTAVLVARILAAHLHHPLWHGLILAISDVVIDSPDVLLDLLVCWRGVGIRALQLVPLDLHVPFANVVELVTVCSPGPWLLFCLLALLRAVDAR